MTYWQNLWLSLTGQTPYREHIDATHVLMPHQPAPNYQPPTTNYQLPTTANSHVTITSPQQPVTNNQQPPTSNQQPATNNQNEILYPYAGQPQNPPLTTDIGVHIHFDTRTQWEAEVIKSLNIYGKIYGNGNHYFLLLNPQHQDHAQTIISYVHQQTQ